jgi:8-amino-7-oxononanoate synthase
MKLLAALEQQLQLLDEQNLRRRRRIVDSPCAPRVEVEGREMLAFCSNDYLGLASHPALIAAMHEGVNLYGVGSGASHLISGHTGAHADLEERLADFLEPHIPDADVLSFSTGYLANLALLAALTATGQHGAAEIFSEELNHASLIDGARLSRAEVSIYPHSDLDALESLLAASRAETKVVVTDCVFSMDGDLAPLPELLALCERHDAWLLADDAHGFGVLGENGRGALEHFGLRSPNLVYMGTLGKAAGVGGAFVAAHETVIEWLVQRARPYIYTTAAPPALAYALYTAIDLIEGEEGKARRSRLQMLIARLGRGLDAKPWRLLPSDTAIQPLIIGANREALLVAHALYERGIWIPAIRPPTVPPESARLRITLSAAHSEADVALLCDTLNKLARSTGGFT